MTSLDAADQDTRLGATLPTGEERSRAVLQGCVFGLPTTGQTNIGHLNRSVSASIGPVLPPIRDRNLYRRSLVWRPPGHMDFRPRLRPFFGRAAGVAANFRIVAFWGPGQQ